MGSDSIFGISYDANGSSRKNYLKINTDGSLNIGSIVGDIVGSVSLDPGDVKIGAVEIQDDDTGSRLDIVSGGAIANYLGAELMGGTNEVGSVHVTEIDVVDSVTNLAAGSVQLNQGVNEIGSVHVTEIDTVDVVTSVTDIAGGSIQLQHSTDEIGSVHVTRVDAITNLEGGSVQLQSGIAEIGSVSVQGYEAVDAASTMNPIITGRVAESTVPTEVSDGDVVKSWTDTFGRQVLKGFNLGQEALDVNEVAPALLQTMTQTGITQLTAAGSTADINVEEYGVYGYTYTVAAVGSAVGSSVTVELQGSIDGTNWCTLPIDNTAVQSESITLNQVNVDQDGTYIIYSSAPVVYTHFNWTAEDGTTATIDADFFARRK